MSDEAAGTPGSPAAHDAPHDASQDAPQPPRPAEEPEEPEAAEPDFPAASLPGPTGDPRVDAAVARLAELGGRPVSEHVELYEDVHRGLQELLASAGQDEPSPPPQAPRPAFPDALRPR
ncbi:hypothetical protein [Actinomadura monticuli]|uniref:Uncharacterized protein n=1 Tax=Actinomadura monticuli TaxID=3097367 RepID=A0ABV4Q3C4_9ACTN